MEIVLSRDRERMLGTMADSQWWDSVRVLAINLWNLAFGRWWPVEPPAFHPALSAASRYTAGTIEPWWNRAVFEGFSARAVLAIVVALIAVASVAAWRVRRLAARESGAA
jgi:hypothetical protein